MTGIAEPLRDMWKQTPTEDTKYTKEANTCAWNYTGNGTFKFASKLKID